MEETQCLGKISLGGIQFRKPNDIAFRIMQNRWRVPFEQLVYVGDNPNKDFQAPRQLGMRWIYLFNKNGIYSNKNYKDRICYGIDNLEKTLLYMISAFPIGIIMIIMIWGFIKDIKIYMKKELKGKEWQNN